MEKMRKMSEKDKETIFNMMREFYNSPALITTPSDEVLQRNISDCISGNPYIEGFVFEENETVIGYAMTAKSYSTEFGGICVWIEDLYLLPEYRHKGIGSRFFTYLEVLYRGTAVVFRLEAERENENAVEVYKKNGFTELPYIELKKEI